MNRISFFLICILSSILLVAFKSDCKNVHWGTKTTYVPLQTVYSTPPEGYEPVFINYAGRHGARHLTSITADSIMFLVLQKAEQQHAITDEGKKLKQMDSLLLIVEKGNVSFISERGKEELQAIAKRMAQNFSTVFANKQGEIVVSTTKKERTKQSAKAFLKGLNPDTTQKISMNYNDDDLLAFYDVAPSYKTFKETGKWKSVFENIQQTEKAKKLYEELPKAFFTPEFIKTLETHSLVFSNKKGNNAVYDSKMFVDGFYDACSIVASLDTEIIKAGNTINDLDFSSLVSCSDLEELEYINSAEDFLVKSSGIEENGIQVRIAAPLLLSFVQATDDYIATKKVIANLRFAHAETIAPFAAILGITGASEPIKQENILDYNKQWKCETIIPLSANIQMILFKNKANNYLVKFLLNEKEVTINGLKDIGTPFYYNWTDVKKFYSNKLDKMNLHAGENVHDYLMKIQ